MDLSIQSNAPKSVFSAIYIRFCQQKKTSILREGSQKKCTSMVFDQTEGGVTQNQILIAKIFFLLKLTICPQTYPIHKEIVISAVLVINSLCGDHFLIA